jgi:hypothetical protein
MEKFSFSRSPLSQVTLKQRDLLSGVIWQGFCLPARHATNRQPSETNPSALLSSVSPGEKGFRYHCGDPSSHRWSLRERCLNWSGSVKVGCQTRPRAFRERGPPTANLDSRSTTRSTTLSLKLLASDPDQDINRLNVWVLIECVLILLEKTSRKKNSTG